MLLKEHIISWVARTISPIPRVLSLVICLFFILSSSSFLLNLVLPFEDLASCFDILPNSLHLELCPWFRSYMSL